MSITDPTSHIPLHPLDFQVLLVLLEGERHGYGIAKAIEEKDTRLGRIYPTNLYRRLRDMARAGVIRERKTSAQHGKHVSTFQITAFGRRVAVEEAHRLESMVVDARRFQLLPQRPGGR
jgi:DNA-binding PadR family transcriptional regulator